MYYSIHRKDQFKEGWGINNNLDFSNPRMTEIFIEMYILICGQVDVLSIPYYYRQYGKSIGNSANLSDDFIDEMLKFNWYKDMNNILDFISKKIGKVIKIQPNIIKLELINSFKIYLRPWIINGIDLKGNSSSTVKARRLMIQNSLKYGVLSHFYKKCVSIKTYFSFYIFNKKSNTKDFKIISYFLSNFKLK